MNKNHEITTKIYLLLIFFPILLVQVSNAQPAAQLLSGPMISHTTSSFATIWIETDIPAEVKAHYWFESGLQPIVKDTAMAKTDKEAPHVGTIKLEGIPARALVHYELEINGRIVRPQTVQSFIMMQGTESSANFKVAFTSCVNPIRVPLQPVWTQMGILRPDALLLIGDNNYMPMRPEAYEAPESTVSYALARCNDIEEKIHSPFLLSFISKKNTK